MRLLRLTTAGPRPRFLGLLGLMLAALVAQASCASASSTSRGVSCPNGDGVALAGTVATESASALPRLPLPYDAFPGDAMQDAEDQHEDEHEDDEALDSDVDNDARAQDSPPAVHACLQEPRPRSLDVERGFDRPPRA